MFLTTLIVNIYSIFSILVVFITRIIIEIIRIYTIEKLYMKPLNYISSILENFLKKYIDLELIEELYNFFKKILFIK